MIGFIVSNIKTKFPLKQFRKKQKSFYLIKFEVILVHIKNYLKNIAVHMHGQ